MRLLRLKIENYRNFEHVNCGLGKHAVLLGENGAGKSNLLRALRLVLDPELPDAERYLEAEDFWAGVVPFAGSEIVVSVDLTDYADSPALLACLGDHEVEGPEGWEQPVARLTYRYGPKQSLEEAQRAAATKDDYEFVIYGRDDTSNEIRRDVRRFIMFKLLPALRDAEADLRAWKRSPLRPLLEELMPTLDAAALRDAASGIDSATHAIAGQEPLVELRERIVTRVSEMIGRQHRLSPTLGFASTDPTLMLRSLKLFVDPNRRWEVSETSLGLANVIYLALLLLHARGQENADQLAAMLLGIEEPEAHLHPQMQRQVFRDLLSGSRPVLVSTHSPNIASVAPVDSLIVLRTDGDKSTLRSFADAQGFTAQQRADLAHYLDVTRAEILFGRGIILVEGDAEKFIVPAGARLLDPPIELDDYGVSVCSVSGTDFVPYAKLLHHLGIPYVVVTDGDSSDVQATVGSPGIIRGLEILKATGQPIPEGQENAETTLIQHAVALLRERGVFVGKRTLEVDMFDAGAGARMAAAYREIRPRTREETLAPFSASSPADDAVEARILELIDRRGVGKGRFAQRIAAGMSASDIPEYVRDAIRSIISRCTHV